MDEILEILEKDARTRPEEIAQMLNMDVDQVKKKIVEYEEQGIILGYKTVINKEALGLTRDRVVALIEVKVTPEKDVGFDKAARRIYRFDEVKSCYLVSGDYDLLLIVEGKDIHTVASFVAEKLSPMESVKSTRTHFMLKRYKKDGIVLTAVEEDRRLNITF